MNGYGDKDVEDVYDAGDPLEVRVAVLERIVTGIASGDPFRRDVRLLDAIRVAGNLSDDVDAARLRLAVILDTLDEMG